MSNLQDKIKPNSHNSTPESSTDHTTNNQPKPEKRNENFSYEKVGHANVPTKPFPVKIEPTENKPK